MTDEPRSEQERIREVYAGYAGRRDRWDHTNPGNAAIERERFDVIEATMVRLGLRSLTESRLLDIGCGDGLVLAELVSRGLRPEAAVGVDLLDDRLGGARRRLPTARIERQDATRLTEPDDIFDLVVLFTVLSSVLDPSVRASIATEAVRVLRPGGAVLFYDMRVPNPQNRKVKPVRRSELEALFPSCRVEVCAVTVVPQLARRLGGRTDRLYPSLTRRRALCTHLAGVIVTPG